MSAQGVSNATAEKSPIYDAHVHDVPSWWYTSVPGAAPPIHAEISNVDLIAAAARDGYGSRRILSASVEILYGVGHVDDDQLRRLNESIAASVRDQPDALLGFGTVNAFAGDVGGDEVRHAVSDLGLSGVIIDSARRAALVGQPETLPALAAAAELGVPAFVHPVWTEDVERVRSATGSKAAGWGRGYRTGLALLQLLEADVFKAIPGLKLVFTALGVGAFFFAHDDLAELRASGDAVPELYVDTTSLHAPSIRYAIDALGPGHIVIGTDWPFHDDDRQAVLDLVASLGLAPREQEAVLHRNLARLLDPSPVASATRP